MQSRYGFTLLELIVTVSIIAITATIGLTSYGQAQRSARNNRRKADLKAIQAALETYFVDNRFYPTNNTYCGDNASYYNACGADWIPATNGVAFVGTYMRSLPRDPNTLRATSGTGNNACLDPRHNTYLYISNGTDYKVLAHCTVEGGASQNQNDEFKDARTYAWSVYTPAAAGW